MATKPDVTIPSDEWVSAYVITGIIPSTEIKIVNKSSSYVLVQLVVAQPSDTDNSGPYIAPTPDFTSSMTITGEAQVWVKSASRVALVNISES